MFFPIIAPGRIKVHMFCFDAEIFFDSSVHQEWRGLNCYDFFASNGFIQVTIPLCCAYFTNCQGWINIRLKINIEAGERDSPDVFW